ncbi:MAG: hypothetical protein ABR538_00215 [Candidatus Binatia bacterium]
MSGNSRNSKKMWGLAALVLVAGLFLWRTAGGPGGQDDESAPLARGTTGEVASDPSATSTRRGERRTGANAMTKDQEAVSYLREQFGATISNKRTQIKALEKLIAYLMEAYPDDWQERLQGFLSQAFPELASQLYAQYQNMTAYNDWLAANRVDLSTMTPAERRDAMREARFRFFGADAEQIWEEAIRHERIYDAMDEINQSPDVPVDEKLSKYVDSIEQVYGEKAPGFIERRQTELMNGFLTLPAVQEDLHAMSPEARARQLDQVREKMGLDEEARTRWRDLDQQRDQAWDTGERYMEQRNDILKNWQGDEQASRLEALRTRTFGAEADIIGQEEASGFFRFDHRRVYGKE